MSWQVIADEDFTAAYGARVLSFTQGVIIEGEVARYLAATGAPVTAAPELELAAAVPATSEPSAPAGRPTATPRRRGGGGARQRG